jgi:tRNA (mo5U34)-methyltransferase
MLSYDKLFRDLLAAGINLPREQLEPLLKDALSDGAHGRIAEWREVLRQLPNVDASTVSLNNDTISVNADQVDEQTQARLRDLLLKLAPWRKGPFNLFGIKIDSEWRSQLKWNRLRDIVAPLVGRTILDVGCGNGYYALRMCGQNAKFVLGIDPTINHVVQFLALQKYLRQNSVYVLPLRLHELPSVGAAFDTTFSMGVLYHQRASLEHLAQLRETLRPGGELVLETLILRGDGAGHVTPDDRYARMRNVWQLPTITELKQWLAQTGFTHCRVADISVTDTTEQRSTEWMPFESLEQALDPTNPQLTIEGLPRPTRALLVCTTAEKY